jgi:hypothetical protein
MRVAICFYGQPRKYKKVLDQWQKVIKELNADVFIHSWYGVDRGRNEIDINQLTKDFNPKEIEISDKHKFIELIPHDATYQNQSYHAMQQAYTISKCFKLLVEHSTNFNKKYDIIIKTRMDIELENVDELINFVKSKIDSDKLYVAGNHWIGASTFDDNIMVAKSDVMVYLFLQYFKYTIQFINTTKLIPGGEQNIFNYINDMGVSKLIDKVTPLNFVLIPYKLEEIILNENEK